MRLVTYVHRSLYDSLMSQHVTYINNTNLVLWDRRLGDFNGIPCLAGAAEYRSISYLTIVEFYPHWQISEYFEDSDWILLELEVPEDEVAQIRPREEDMLHCIDATEFRYTRKDVRIFRDKLRWLRDFYKESRYKEHDEEAVFAVLNCIKRDWIVSISEFLYFSKEWYYTKYHHTLYMNCRKFPLWREPSYLDYNMRKAIASQRYPDAPKLKEGVYPKYDQLIAFQNRSGMHGCPGYFTVTEAMACCDSVTKGVISNAIKRKGLSKRSKDLILIQDLFEGDLVKVDNISDEKLRLLGGVFTKGTTRESIQSTYSDEEIKTIYKYITGHEPVLVDVDIMVNILLDTANVYC